MTDINQNLRYFGQQQADIDQAKILAQALRESNMLNNYNPNQMVGDRVVPLSPVTALIGGLTKGYESYLNARNTREQSDLNTRKKEILSNLFSGNEMPSMAMLSQSGMFEPNELFDLYQKKQDAEYKRNLAQSQRDYVTANKWQKIEGEKGSYRYNPVTNVLEPIMEDGLQIVQPQYYGPLQEDLSQSKQRGKEKATIHEIDTMHGKQFLRGDQLTNGRMPAPMGNPKPVFESHNGKTNVIIYDPENLSQFNRLVQQDPSLMKDPAIAEQYNAALGIQQPNVPPQQGFGITPEQKIALEVQKQREIDENKKQVDLNAKMEEETNLRKRSAQDTLEQLDGVEDIIKNSSSGIQQDYNAVSAYTGLFDPTKSAEYDGQLNIIANNLTAAIKKAPGAQSDKELLFAQRQAGDLNNPNLPKSQRLASAKWLKDFAKRRIDIFGQKSKPTMPAENPNIDYSKMSVEEIKALRNKNGN